MPLTLDKKSTARLLEEVARKHPDRYRQVSQAINQLGWQAAQESGGYSFGMNSLARSKASAAIRTRLEAQINELIDDDSLTDQQRDEAIVKLTGAQMGPQQDAVLAEALAGKNPLAMQVVSGARGNKVNLTSLLGSDLLYTDHHDRVIPVPVLHSYAEGLAPAEYFAGAYGARKGLTDLKFATADAGFFGKQLAQASHRLVVAAHDYDQPPEGPIGLPVDADDSDNEGALLARDTGVYKRNTVLNPKIMASLKRQGHDRILVRSPIVGGHSSGGVLSRDVGVRESGALPGVGSHVGMSAAQASSEQLSQSTLGSKHAGGVAGASKAVSSFDYINSLVQIPRVFHGRAVHSDADGIVARIEAAPAGGHKVFINGVEHYTPEDTPPTVKPGDRVEAGDAITGGFPNPSKVVEHKGIGEGRRYFAHSFRKALREAGLKAHRRNAELLARGLINHVELTDEYGDSVPGDLLPYSEVEQTYEPRPDSIHVSPARAAGKYLERPVLHYSIGTRLSPGVVKELEEFDIKKVHAHDRPPGFRPVMIRGMQNLANDPDWMTSMYGSGLKGSFLKHVHRGATSDEAGSSFVPSIARSVDFGRGDVVVRQPEPDVKVQG